DRTLARYGSKPDCEINLEGVSKLYRLGGYIRFVPREYWEERVKLKAPINLYNDYAKKTELVLINANQDNILGKMDVSELSQDIKVISLDGDHNFNGEGREGVKKILKEIICN
ncbi:MAG: hypothetical protein ACREGC_03905, partial [Minisyncoccia bacterium]